MWIHLTLVLVSNAAGNPWYVIATLDEIDKYVQQEEQQQLFIRQSTATLKQSREENEDLQVLQAITDTALTHLDLDDFFQAVLGRIRAIMKADNIAILLFNEAERLLEVRTVQGIEEAVASHVRIPFGQGFAGTIAAQCRPLIVHDNTPVEVLTPVLRKELHSLLGVPLVAQGRVRGVIHIGMKDHRDFTEEDVHLFQRVADRLALEIDRTVLYEQAKQAQQEALAHAQRMKTINESLQDFVAIISHQFRTALTSIAGFSSLLCAQEVDRDEATSLACDIYTDSQRLVGLITEILEFERFRMGKSDFHPELLDVRQLLQEEIHRAQGSTRKHTFHLSVDPSLPHLYADREKLHHVVANLLSNAVKYAPQGGAIELACVREGDWMHLSVRDYGIGIQEQVLSKLFTPYTRITSEQTRYIQGTGLGLAIVRQIVELHQGKVWAESTVGQGSTFHVLLPLASCLPRAG